MNFDVERFLSNSSLEYRTKGVNVPKEAVNIKCIYCGEQRFHLVIRKRMNYGNCWVCKVRKSVVEIVKDIAGCTWNEARQIVFGDRIAASMLLAFGEQEEKQVVSICKLPKFTYPLSDEQWANRLYRTARNYLDRRSVCEADITEFDLHYGVEGEQAYRVVIPMYFGGKLVTYTGRDWTERSELRYRACPTDLCVLLPTDFLYGYDTFVGHRAIVVEGAFDKIATGKQALAASTNKLSSKQKAMIARLDIDELVFVLDPDAADAAEELAYYFRPIVKRVKIVKLTGGDPAKVGRAGVMSQIERAKWFDY